MLANVSFIFLDLLFETCQVLLRVQAIVTAICIVVGQTFVANVDMGLGNVLFGETADVAV